MREAFRSKWEGDEYDKWMEWSLSENDRPLLRTFEQYATAVQKRISIATTTSMRQVDRSGELEVTNIDTRQD